MERAPASATFPALKNGITVLQLDPLMPVGRLRKLGYKVRTLAEIERRDPWSEPDPKLRDRLFASAGLSEATKTWDHLDRDMLFLRAQEQRLDFLTETYPKIPRALLAQLQRKIRREKDGKR